MPARPRLKVGSIVACRLFNDVDKRFYGRMFTGKVTNIEVITGVKWYTVKESNAAPLRVKRKEIKKVIS